MLAVVNYFLGWVLIEVRGAYVERFLNLCSAAGIGFWGMERIAEDRVRMCITVAGFRAIPVYARRAMCRVHILKKCGLRFHTVRLRSRAALVAGLAIALAAVWVMTSFIWSIDITAYDGADTEALSRYLSENGVRIGALTRRVDTERLQNHAYVEMPELSYFGINISGSRVHVHIRERAVPPEVESGKDAPANIVAKRAGIITSIVVQNGTPEAAAGDAVQEGQLLASGFMTGREGTTVTVRAKADVRARTWHTVTSMMPLKTHFKTYTGREKSRRTLVFGEKRIKLYINSGIPYAECDKIINTTVLTLPGDIHLPLKLERETLREYVSEEGEISPEDALEYLSERLEDAIELEEGARLIERRYNAGFKDGNARVTVIAECEEQIGTEQKIAKASE